MSKSILKKLLRVVDPLAIALNLVILSLAIFFILNHTKLPPLVPLWFSKSWGLERLAVPQLLWLLPALITVFFFVNNLIANFLFDKRSFLARVLVWSAVGISLFFLFSVYKILLLVT